MERDVDFLYIGLEVAVATLKEVVEGPSVTTGGTRCVVKHARLMRVPNLQVKR
jgi:hypothetical protein